MRTTNLLFPIFYAFAIVLFIAPVASIADAARNPAIHHDDQALGSFTLRGLTRVFVEVEGVHRDFEKFGLTAQNLKSQIETELRNHGIEVTNRDALLNDPQVARLRIKINANENQYRFYHYGVKLELAQKIPMNERGGYIAETTWTSGQTGVIMPMDLRRLGVYAQDLVTMFLKDYHAQNPKVASNKGH